MIEDFNMIMDQPYSPEINISVPMSTFLVIFVIAVTCVIYKIIKREKLLKGQLRLAAAAVDAYEETDIGEYKMTLAFTTEEGETIFGEVNVRDIKFMKKNYPPGTLIKIHYSPEMPNLAWRLDTDKNGNFVKINSAE